MNYRGQKPSSMMPFSKTRSKTVNYHGSLWSVMVVHGRSHRAQCRMWNVHGNVLVVPPAGTCCVLLACGFLSNSVSLSLRQQLGVQRLRHKVSLFHPASFSFVARFLIWTKHTHKAVWAVHSFKESDIIGLPGKTCSQKKYMYRCLIGLKCLRSSIIVLACTCLLLVSYCMCVER